MAIKAGLVGVNPKGVDKNGMPIGSGGSVDAYTKAETDTLLNGKVSNSQLTANNKTFHFAYDSTSEKYGYKLDGTGDFIPFEQAGGGPGWVAPATFDPTLVHLSSPNDAEIVFGGAYVDNGIVYIDAIVHQTGGAGNALHIPLPKNNTYFLQRYNNDLNDAEKYYATYYKLNEGSSSQAYLTFGNTSQVGRYTHWWGMYELAES